MPRGPRQPRPPRVPAPRYSVAEWYGRDITALTDEERQTFGQIASRQMETGDLSETLPCPFLSNLIPGSRCNKKGGVCSIRKFAATGGGAGAVVPGDNPVTTCPLRFIQDVEDGKSIFVWVAEKMLDISDPIVVKETPFLRKVSDPQRPVEAAEDPAVAQDVEEEAEAEKKAGRIDWILVKPESMANADDMEWCAVETQALYFSGKKMKHEFDAYAAAPGPVLYPIENRRPDYRSSGPKRLSPQLDVKVPVLGRWGKKVVIVIDRFFFDNMNRLEEAFARARDDRARRDNAEVVWFIVDYDEQMRLRAREVHYTTLDSSRKALNATEPLDKVAFTHQLKAVINNPQRANKVFRVSSQEAHE